ncbi:MAG: class I SAM-dependent methyltransferase [Spirochaetes bacterium]|nr:class I SAM-dependent methyltransferase [Spirochaetota bacterium]
MSEPSFENKTLGLSENLLNYIKNLAGTENPVLTELREFTSNHPQKKMQISPEQGTILSFLIKCTGAVNALEIGVFTGYSSLLTALSLPADGKLTAVDRSEEFTGTATEYWKKAGVENKIDLLLGDANDVLDSLLETKKEFYDFIFIDADKKNYISYYEKSLNLLSAKGIIIIDNVLWRGLVAEESADDRITVQVREFNRYVSEDRRTEMCIIPVTDGMMLVRKK